MKADKKTPTLKLRMSASYLLWFSIDFKYIFDG